MHVNDVIIRQCVHFLYVLCAFVDWDATRGLTGVRKDWRTVECHVCVCRRGGDARRALGKGVARSAR